MRSVVILLELIYARLGDILKSVTQIQQTQAAANDAGNYLVLTIGPLVIKGDKMANFQLPDSQKSPFTLVEFDAANQPVAPQPTDVVSIVSSNPSAASVALDTPAAAGTSASGFIMGSTQAPGVVISASITHADGSVVSTSQTIDVTGGSASSLVLTLGPPVSK